MAVNQLSKGIPVDRLKTGAVALTVIGKKDEVIGARRIVDGPKEVVDVVI